MGTMRQQQNNKYLGHWGSSGNLTCQMSRMYTQSITENFTNLDKI